MAFPFPPSISLDLSCTSVSLLLLLLVLLSFLGENDMNDRVFPSKSDNLRLKAVLYPISSRYFFIICLLRGVTGFFTVSLPFNVAFLLFNVSYSYSKDLFTAEVTVADGRCPPSFATCSALARRSCLRAASNILIRLTREAFTSSFRAASRSN